MEPTQNVLKIFEELSAVPRGSGREAQISAWLQARASAHGFASSVDETGNLLIRVPASRGYEAASVIVLQGHMDMVCEKTPDSPHDFTRDPIRCVVEGDWLHADHTTLGADNGIAIALGLALAEDPALMHPALEMLFTVQEEAGLGGANQLKPGFVRGKILLNLDSEEEGTFIVGCAGGQVVRMSLPLPVGNSPFQAAFLLRVSGLQGGHSGVDIHKHRASANKLLARALAHLQKVTPLALSGLDGGTAHNAISREAQAVFACIPGKDDALRQAAQEFESVLNDEYVTSEAGCIRLALEPQNPGPAASVEDSARAIRLLLALPHGVDEMSASVPGFVETSNNLARVEMTDGCLKVVTSQRSNVMTRIQALSERIAACGELAGAQVEISPAYPGWQPDMKSPLLRRSVELYRELFGSAPQVSTIHAGLECGTIGAICGGMDMISLGATIENPHSPAERLFIPSIKRVWRYLAAFLEASK